MFGATPGLPAGRYGTAAAVLLRRAPQLPQKFAAGDLASREHAGHERAMDCVARRVTRSLAALSVPHGVPLSVSPSLGVPSKFLWDFPVRGHAVDAREDPPAGGLVGPEQHEHA